MTGRLAAWKMIEVHALAVNLSDFPSPSSFLDEVAIASVIRSHVIYYH
jgi:hypothetical protein